MEATAFVLGSGSAAFFCSQRWASFDSAQHHSSRPKGVLRLAQKRTRSRIVCSGNGAEPSNGKQLEPVEDGVKLPQVESRESLEEETQWLERQLRDWLDQEWRQGEPQSIHAEIGMRTAKVYSRQRMEGEDDLSSVLIAIGSELEGMDFSDAFVGPWNIANKTAEFLLEHRAGPRVRMKPYVRDPNAPTFSGEMQKRKEQKDKKPEQKEHRAPSAPSLADYFEKLKFLRDVLDEDVSKELIDGAVAVAVGYRYDTETGNWDCSGVEDEHFKEFGDMPPDVLGDESVAEYTETLKYLESQLVLEKDDVQGEEDESGAKGLDMIVETLHGAELMAVQMNNENDHAFHKRAVVVKWLHLHGGF